MDIKKNRHIPEGFALDDYYFALPEGQIAQSPATTRGTSRLLIMDRQGKKELQESIFTHLCDFLPPNCLLIVNNSKVVPARVFGKRESGGKVEFLLLTPLPLLDISSCQGEPDWHCAIAEGLLRSSKKLAIGERVFFAPNFALELIEYHDYGQCRVRLLWLGGLEKLLAQHGVLPLPPYIKRSHETDDTCHPSHTINKNGKNPAQSKAVIQETSRVESLTGIQTNQATVDQHAEDANRYQTVYNNHEKAGSVAAPTAGLHFTDALQKELQASGREWAEVTLYVGYGTFSPVRTEDIREHTMHKEYVELSAEVAEKIIQAKKENRPIIAVGTTSARVVEGAYRAIHGEKERQQLQAYAGWVDIFLYPGAQFYVIDGLITNFHLPHSSLLMLVSAFAGRKNVLNAYAAAIQRKFQFFSYGDAMLIT